MRIAVAGGTGLVGSLIDEEARRRGHDVRVLARSEGVDLSTGAGIAAGVLDADVVIDVSSTATMNPKAAAEFFTTATENLLEAEREAGIRHHILLSIVGVDRAPVGYYAGKLAQEEAVAAGDVPWTILRATQFHEFAEQMIPRASVGPFRLTPHVPVQPVAAAEVASRLVDLAEGAPSGRVPDLAGPQREDLGDMMRAIATARGIRGPFLGVTPPIPQMRAMASGAMLPDATASLGSQTFAEWLAS